jgi:hypothetical protein
VSQARCAEAEFPSTVPYPSMRALELADAFTFDRSDFAGAGFVAIPAK